MIRNYQQRQRLNPPKAPIPEVAKIVAINGGTARIQFSDGGISQKYYKLVGTGYTVGQRVFIRKHSGTYIIEGAV